MPLISLIAEAIPIEQSVHSKSIFSLLPSHILFTAVSKQAQAFTE
jgi:hypothetical protein